MYIIRNFLNNSRFRIWRLYRALLSPCTIEIHLADHCNLNCFGCNHFSPIAPKKFQDFESVRKNLLSLKGINLNFRLLGGEPLLNKEIEKYIYLIRSIFKKAKIEIITNGIILQKKKLNYLSASFFETCKNNDIIVSITKYPINIDYNEIIEILSERQINYKIFGDHMNKQGFKTYKFESKNNNHLFKYYKCIDFTCLQLVNDRLYVCPQMAYINFINKKFNKNFLITSKDYLMVNNIKSIWTIKRFRLFSKPFCGYCSFPRKEIPWDLSQKVESEWIEN